MSVPPLTICTIGDARYLPQINTLRQSLELTNPTARLFVLILDRQIPEATPTFEALSPKDIVSPLELDFMRNVYSTVELATALKPFLLRFLASRSSGPVIYLDPDTLVTGDLRPLRGENNEGRIGLTPHVIQPFPRDGRTPTEQHIMRAGIFNLGFIRVPPTQSEFLDWWAERLLTDSQIDLERGLFTDQRWIDWVPSLFPVEIIKHPGANVAYWNLHERQLHGREDTLNRLSEVHQSAELTELLRDHIEVNKSDLLFFHFSGAVQHPKGDISHHMGPRPRSFGHYEPLARAIVSAYLRCVVENRDSWTATVGSSSMDVIPPKQAPELSALDRIVLRGRVAFGAELDPIGLLGHFRSKPNGVMRNGFKFKISNNSNTRSGQLVQITVSKIWRKVTPRRVSGSLGWNAPRGRTGTSAPVSELASIAYASRSFGVGQAAFRLRKALHGSRESLLVTEIDINPDLATRFQRLAVKSISRSDALLLSVNADQTESVLGSLSWKKRSSRVIANWYWELNNIPTWFGSAARGVDEIWVTSEFQRMAMSQSLSIPVRLISLPLYDQLIHEEAEPLTAIRSENGPFEFLTVFDMRSVVERKNPLGTIRAYKAAFAPGGETRLKIKISNPSADLAALRDIEWETRNREDIKVLTGQLDQAELAQLFRQSNAFVSLHRSEGLGLNISDAMAFGIPAIATSYGGCTDFMNSDNSFPIGYSLVRVGAGCGPYNPEAQWAEPDIEEAREIFRLLSEDPQRAKVIGEKGRQFLKENYDLETSQESVSLALNPK